MGTTGTKLRPDDSLSDEDIRALAGDLGDLLDFLDDPFDADPAGPAELALRLRQAQSPFLQRRRGLRFGAPVDPPFNAAWLSLREAFDGRARNRALAHRFAAMLPEPATLVELGAGTGNLFRWLAPILARPQHWICVDHDEEHLERGLRLSAAWARRLGYTAEPSEDWTELTLRSPHGAWTIRTEACDLEEMPLVMLPLDEADAVVCSALLDLFSEDWLNELLHVIDRRPFYAAMNVTGQLWRNRRDPDDALVLEGFRRNQIGDGPPTDGLGPYAPHAAEALAEAIGRQHSAARSDWSIGPRDRAMLRHVLAFHAGGARNALPQHSNRIDAWEARRRQEVDAGRLAMRIGHSDILVSPPEKGPRHAARRRR